MIRIYEQVKKESLKIPVESAEDFLASLSNLETDEYIISANQLKRFNHFDSKIREELSRL